MKATTFILAISALGASALAGQHEHTQHQGPVPAKLVHGVQTATITIAEGKYTPSTISVKKGVPVALTFKGGKKMGCGSIVEFKSLKMKQTVKEGKTVVFKFTPNKAGEVLFACSMNMYKGKVVVK